MMQRYKNKNEVLSADYGDDSEYWYVGRPAMKRTVWLVLLIIMIMIPSAVSMGAETYEPSLEYTKMLLYVGGKYQFSLKNASGKVKWTTTNSRIASVNKKGKVTAKKAGSCKLIATCNRKKYRCTIVVKTDKAFLKSWCNDTGARIMEEYSSVYDRVIFAARYISSYLKYGSSSGAFDTLKKRRGTCVGGNALLAELLKGMGYKAKLRFAANDNMSRYPSGIIFASQHHNVRVTIEGKTCYVDGTPGSMMVYLTTENEPIYFATSVFGEWTVMLDKVPGHAAQETEMAA